MDSYFELKALPDPEIIQSAVVSELMQAVHSLLINYDGRVGIDFPAYGQQRTLGGIIRLLGNQQDMDSLRSALAEHRSVQDYGLLTARNVIPDNISGYVCCSRRHTKGSNSRFQRLKKRHQARGTWSESLEQTILQKFAKPLHLPHVALKSASTGQRLLLFIERKHNKQQCPGQYNSYGLGLGGASVPAF